ncbi:MAG: hypothetical protein R3300_10360 [Candidatus Promineifilaceae bacterium]|nr:hypothetical protein [Candidatus Promineifilaceae bacterium]
MKPEGMKFATLSEEQLARVQNLESETGTMIVALEPEFKLARLSREQIAQLQALEHELGVVLLAYQQE